VDVGRELAALATRQDGVVSLEQLRALGLDKHWARNRLAAGWLHRIHRGVYALGHTTLSVRARYIAALLAGGPDAALSHRSAGALWDLCPAPTRIAITIPHGRKTAAGLEVHRSRLQFSADFTRRHGIRVTTVARTLLDLAGILTSLRLSRAIDRAERQDLFDLNAIEALLLRAPNRKGAKALRQAIAAYRPRRTRRELEDRFLDLIQAARLPDPNTNVLLQGDTQVHEVDSYFPGTMLVVELDSFAFHRTRLDHEKDAAKTADLELAGYRVVRLTWDEVTRHDRRTTHRLRRLLSDT
jgi:very-short-patch-repair endonuclease